MNGCFSASAKKNISKKSIRVNPPAKINLYLNVLGKRKDGFHDISSIVQRVSFYDDLFLELTRGEGVSLDCDCKEISCRDNLAFKAAVLMKDKFKIGKRIKMRLKKNIPLGSGLGGASSDAAYVVLALNDLIGLNLKDKELFRIGERLGSDVNFFLTGSSAAELRSRGEKVEPINHSLDMQFLLILTGENVSTKSIYSEVSPQLTKYIDNAKLIKSCLKNKDLELLEKLFFNSLTKPYLESSSKARKIWDILLKLESCSFFLSGSGSTIVILIKDKHKRFNIDGVLSKLGVKFLQVNTF